MKRTPLSLVPALFAAIAFAQSPPEKPASGRRAPVAAPNGTLLVGINDMIGRVAEPGWPLIVMATKVPDDANPATLPAAFILRLATTSGTVATVTFEPVPPLPDQPTRHCWFVAESATASLSAGTYRVSAVPGQPQLAGWRVEPGEFKIVVPDPARKNLRSHLWIHRFIVQGRTDDALAAADQLTRDSAGDSDAWIAKGDIHMIKDEPREALAAFARAANLYEEAGREPIGVLRRQRAAFQRSLEKQGVVSPP